MVIRHFIAAIMLLAGSVCASAQLNRVNRLPEVEGTGLQHDYTDNQTGFWMAGEVSTGYSCRLFHSNFGFTELDAVGGYRFSEYLRVGLGVGGRYYFDNDRVRYSPAAWSFPIFANVRGSFIPTQYRSVVPFYSFDIGGTIRDGFMVRPSVGMRIGRERSSFVVSLGYVGQDLTSFSRIDLGKERKFVSFVTLKLGYEF